MHTIIIILVLQSIYIHFVLLSCVLRVSDLLSCVLRRMAVELFQMFI